MADPVNRDNQMGHRHNAHTNLLKGFANLCCALGLTSGELHYRDSRWQTFLHLSRKIMGRQDLVLE